MDERREEQASLYVMGLLDPGEARAFEKEMNADPELCKFVDDLQHHCCGALAHAVPPKTAPAHLREKVLEKICGDRSSVPEETKVVPFLRSVWLPWAIAASLAVVCGWQYMDRDNLNNKVAALSNQNDACQWQVAGMSSMNERGRTASATVVWDSSTQTGIITGQNMPRPAANEDYQLWVIDGQYAQPVDAGIVTVDENGATQTMFKPTKKVSPNDKFAISVEKKGGVPKNEGPIVWMSKEK